ncbi:MAG: MFS transporter [Clostridia bacterium]|nr:MFS transporter [Clostridia bacterium]
MRQYLRLIGGLPFAIKWLLITELLYGFAMGIWGVSLNFHLADKGFNDIGIGNILAIGSIITAAASLIAGSLCGRVGFNKGMFFGSIIRSCGIVIMATAPSYHYIFLGQVLFSIGGAFIESSEFPLLLSLLKGKNVQVAYNLLFCVYQLSMLFGNLCGGFMPGVARGSFGKYGMAILLCGISFALMGISRYLLIKDESKKEPTKMSYNIIKHPMVLWFLLYGLIGGIIANLILPLSLVNTIFRDSFSLSDNRIGIVYSLSTLVSSIAFFIAPIVLSYWRNTRIAFTILVLNMLIFIFISRTGIVLFIILWLAFSFFDSILPGAVESHMLQAIPQKDQGTYSGLGICGNYIGMGIGANLSGLFLTHIDYSWLMILGAVFVFLQLLVYFFGCRKHVADETEFHWQEPSQGLQQLKLNVK